MGKTGGPQTLWLLMRRAALLLALVLGLTSSAARAEDLAQYVDPMIGTLGTGWVFPGAAVPSGMVQNSPDTQGPLVYAGYMGNDAAIRGFSLVHLSGVGVPESGDVPFMPWVGTDAPPVEPSEYAQPFDKAGETARAGYYSVRLGNGVEVELTAATRVAMQRYSFPPGVDPAVIVDPRHNNRTAADGAGSTAPRGSFRRTGESEIAGSTFNGSYEVFFVARFDQPIAEAGENWVRFAGGTPATTVTMRAGISFVDEEGARRNLDAEAPPSKSFDDLREDAYGAWDRELHAIEVQGGTLADRRSFYTALYHALLHPNVFEDVDGRYRGFDDVIRPSPNRTQYANFSLWDTYRGQSQLMATLFPERYVEMLRSLLADAQQGGRLPRWAMHDFDPAYMTGDPAVPTIAEGVCRGIVPGDLAEELYARAVDLQRFRPPGLAERGYLNLAEARYAAATTLEYGVADFALALLARRLGRDAEAQRWLDQSLSYRNLVDPETKWLRPRNADGSWYTTPDSPLGWDTAADQTGYHEGNAWQYAWLVPQDFAGLRERMGADLFDQRLDQLFAPPAEVQNRLQLYGVYYRFATWAPGNEHDLLAPFAYAWTDRPWKVQEELREAQQLYLPQPHGLPGNDDLGSLSAFHIWSTLGLGPFTPGAPLFMVTAPVFERVTMRVGEGRFVVETSGAGPYVQSATLNGTPLTRSWFGADAVRDGGMLQLELGALPSATWGAGAPPSVSDSPLARFGCG